MAIAAPLVIPLAEALAAAAAAAAAVVVGVIGGALVEDAVKARDKAKAEPRAIPKETTDCKDDCARKIQEMEKILNAAAPPGMHPKGLKQRFCEQRHGALAPGTVGWENHQLEIKKDQIRIKKTYVEAVIANCPIPPKLRGEVNYYGDKTLTEDDYQPMPGGVGTFCYQRALEGRSG